MAGSAVAPVIGLCRFSFVGRGDWAAWRGKDPAVETALLEQTAAHLYTPARIAARLWTFEHLTLASLRAQSDPNWHLIVLTSDMMPATMQDRLRTICAGDPRVTLEVSAARDVDSGFLPVFERLGQPRPVQFRIDDDDCLAVSFVHKLRRAQTAMADYRAWSFSMTKGLVATFYAGQAPKAYTFERPFLGAGAATLLPPRWTGVTTIFGFGHFGLMNRWHALLDNEGRGFLVTHLEDQDSARLEPGSVALRGHTPIDWDNFTEKLGRDFDFLDAETLRRVLSPQAR